MSSNFQKVFPKSSSPSEADARQHSRAGCWHVAKLFGEEMQIQAIGEEAGETTNINDFIKTQDRYKAMAQNFSEIWLDKKGGLNAVIKQQLGELKTIEDAMPTISTAQRVTGLATAAAGVGAAGYGISGAANSSPMLLWAAALKAL